MADFGNKMVSDCKHEVIRHFGTHDLDDVSDFIVSIASDSFLDKCLEKRLLTIEAKPLINALARAERLGYEQNDIIDFKNQHEQVIPQHIHQSSNGSLPTAYPTPAPTAPFPTAPLKYQLHSPVEQSPVPQPSSQQQSATPSQPIANGRNSKGREVMQCVVWYRTFVSSAAYQHVSSFLLLHPTDVALTLSSTLRRMSAPVYRRQVAGIGGLASIVVPHLPRPAAFNMYASLSHVVS